MPPLGAIAAALLVPATVSAPVRESPHLWATVNACDTERRPDTIGIRASIPGSGRREVLYVRFRVEYRGDDRRWTATPTDTGYIRAGVSRTRRFELGRNFRFKPPEGGGDWLLRGRVSFEWRRGNRRVRRVTEVTEGGHRSTRGADPRGYSAATCRIR